MKRTIWITAVRGIECEWFGHVDAVEKVGGKIEVASGVGPGLYLQLSWRIEEVIKFLRSHG